MTKFKKTEKWKTIMLPQLNFISNKNLDLNKHSFEATRFKLLVVSP